MIRDEELIDTSVPRLIETALLSPSSTETVVLSSSGEANACDIWFVVPTGWPPDVIIRLYGRLGDARVLLKQVELQDTHRTTAASMASGVAMSVRGRPVTSFELSLESRTTATGSGRFMMQVWSAPAHPRTVGSLTTAPQQLAAEESVIALRSGSIPVFAAGDSSGRALIVGAGAAGLPTGGVVTVQGPGTGGRAAREAARYAITSVGTSKPSLATAATSHYLLTLAASSKRVEIQRIAVSFWGATANTAEVRIVGSRSASAPTVGNGVAVTPRAMDLADPASTCTARSWGTTLTLASPEDLLVHTLHSSQRDSLTFEADAWGKPITLRAGSTDSFGLRLIVDVAAASQTLAVAATVHFIEV